jgi:hypothetical protein
VRLVVYVRTDLHGKGCTVRKRPVQKPIESATTIFAADEANSTKQIAIFKSIDLVQFISYSMSYSLRESE